MNKFNFSRQEDRLVWAILWKTILTNENRDFSFFQISEIKKWVLESELITDVNFHGDFFNNGKYRWPSSLYNAELLVKEAVNYTNLYDLFISEPFESNFNLHRSISSLCEQNEDLIEENISSDIIFSSNFYYTNQTSEEYFKSLNLSTWSYEIVVISAICYLLENVYVKYHNKVKDFYNPNKKSLFYKKPNYLELIKRDISIEINTLIYKIAVYLIDEKYSKKLFYVLSNTNIFRIESFATLRAFTAIFNELTHTQYREYVKNNNSMVEILSRFFQVFQLNFIFCDSFIKNEIQTDILNIQSSIFKGEASRYQSKYLLEILTIYKLFIQNYFYFKNNFKNDSKKSLYFNEPKLEINSQKLFVNTFFYDYISGNLPLEINGAIEVFKKLFPSIQFDILQHFEQTKRNDNLKKKLIEIKNTISFTIGLTGPTLAAYNSFYANSSILSSPSATYASLNSNEAVPAQKSVVRRSPIDIPTSLQRRNFRVEAAQFQQYQEQYRKQFEAVFQQSQLSQSYTMVPQNSSKLGGKNIKGLVFIEDQKTGLLTLIGNVGSYDFLTTILNNSKARVEHNGNTLRKAHFFCDKMRQSCGVSKADGLSWLVPSCINEVEEHPSNQENRDYTFLSSLQNDSLSELILNKTVKSWGYIFQTVTSNSLLDSDTLDFLSISFKKNLGHGIAQLDQRRINLKIAEKKSLFYLYSGHVLQKIEQLTKTVQPYALHVTGEGHTLRLPGQLISEACESVYVLTRLGKTYIEQLDSPAAKEFFSSLLQAKINNFSNEINNVAIANIGYLEAGRQNIPELIISFNQIPIYDVCNPDISEILEVTNQVNDIIQKQPFGDLQEDLETGRKFGIGDFRNQSKPRIKQTGERKPNETFRHIAPALPAVDYSNDDRWVC